MNALMKHGIPKWRTGMYEVLLASGDSSLIAQQKFKLLGLK
jgi:hypothetical protein